MLRFATAAMGTRFELALPAASSAIGELVISEIDEWHRRLNRFAPDSWVSHVNRTASVDPVRCDEDLWALLLDAQAVWRASEGAFDITRGDADGLILDEASHTVAFSRPGMSLDFGGIGKGHALDCCERLLRSHGVTSAFLHGGTSSGLALGHDEAGHPWVIRAGGNTGVARHIELVDSAFSVSDGGHRLHIFDPRSGAGITEGSEQVVVTGPSARLCDAWSTAIVVLGRVPADFPIGYAHATTAAG